MTDTKQYNVAIVGVTGAVGERILAMLEEINFPIKELRPLASKRSAGKEVVFRGESLIIKEAIPENLEGLDIAFFSAGGSVSKQLVPEAVAKGALVIDNTSAYRMDPEVPLVVPEVNKEDIQKNNGIIANPNCSTIQMVAALSPIKEAYGIDRIIVSTYQSVSGAGNAAMDELTEQTKAMLNGEDPHTEIMPVKADKKHFPIAFNALPQIDKFEDNHYTFEEMKMINETKKIFNDETINVAATCVRLPFYYSHAESVYVEINDPNVTVSQFQSKLKDAPGVVLEDDIHNQVYPTPLSAEGKKDVFVGRVRKDLDVPNGFHLWIVSDNILKGAAWNSVQIAQAYIEQ